MGLKLSHYNPGEELDALQFMFRDSMPVAEAREQLAARQKRDREKYRAKPQHMRQPVQAWPGELVFFLRTTERTRRDRNHALLGPIWATLAASCAVLRKCHVAGILCVRSRYHGDAPRVVLLP